jgi:hypothetical protein
MGCSVQRPLVRDQYGLQQIEVPGLRSGLVRDGIARRLQAVGATGVLAIASGGVNPRRMNSHSPVSARALQEQEIGKCLVIAPTIALNCRTSHKRGGEAGSGPNLLGVRLSQPFRCFQNGGAEGIRTPDLLIANETLYQLSYDPIQFLIQGLAH